MQLVALFRVYFAQFCLDFLEVRYVLGICAGAGIGLAVSSEPMTPSTPIMTTWRFT